MKSLTSRLQNVGKRILVIPAVAVGIAIGAGVAYGAEIPHGYVVPVKCQKTESCKEKAYIKDLRKGRWGYITDTGESGWAKDIPKGNLKNVEKLYERAKNDGTGYVINSENGRNIISGDASIAAEVAKKNKWIKVMNVLEKTPEEIARELSPGGEPLPLENGQNQRTEEPSNWNWSAYVGGNSEERGFGELRFGIAKPKEKGTTFDFYLRGYSQAPVEKGNTLTETVLVNEELVGPGIYRIREDEETTRTDIQEGNVEGGIILGYQINSQWTVFARAGALPVNEKKYTTLESTVAFEDESGNPIGEPQTARQDLKPKEKTNLAATGQLGVGWKIPDTSVSIEASVGGVDGRGSRGELGINVDF